MSASKSTTTEVKLLGQKLVLKASETDPEVLKQVIQIVTMKLSEAENRSRGSAPHQVALLALLDLAEEYVKAKKRTLEFQQQVDGHSKQILGMVENDLK
jgi:cell division protein ZapA (FtsZ GTPase activity inhibitor)